MNNQDKNNQIIIYNTENGETKIEVRVEGETVWLSQKQMAELFDCTVDNISLHLRNIFKEAELRENSVTEEYSITASDGKNYTVKHYNLDAIISVGYRINSLRGTQFRTWATQKLKEYIVKGFVMDDERLKGNGGAIIGKSCSTVSVISVAVKKPFIAKCWIYMPRVLIMILRIHSLSRFSKPCRTNFITRPTNSQPQKR